MAQEPKGFLKVYRKFFESDFWTEEREFSRAEAWLDLLNLGAYEPSSKFIRGKRIELDVGELVASERFLAARWGWGRTKLRNFLEILRANHRIATKETSGETIITLVKYRDYAQRQTTEQTNGEPENKPPANHRQTKVIEKEKKEENKGAAKPPTTDFLSLLPEEFRTEEFAGKWDEWIAYRRQRKLPRYPEASLRRLADKVKGWGVSGVSQSIDESIANNWQGLFPEKERKGPGNKSLGLDLRSFRIAYAFMYPSVYSDYPSEETIAPYRADFETLTTKYREVYEEVSAAVAQPFSRVAKHLKTILEKERNRQIA